jgi:hypothetical protein
MCQNYSREQVCNWMLPADSAEIFCDACRLNQIIPDLTVSGNRLLWQRLETGKRRLVYGLLRLGLPVISKQQDPAAGLAFAFMADEEPLFAENTQMMTGHSEGLITINIAEADDAWRERMRQEMTEPYRTLLGHFRHESGHYFWFRLVQRSNWLMAFRQEFGDERVDYASAMQQNYQQGPSADWQSHFVSSYAVTHPWEDWAETWAHYLHMTDTLDTAFSFRLQLDDSRVPLEAFTEDVLSEPEPAGIPPFLPLLNGWIQLTAALNELSLSMGLADFYPFVLSRTVVTKLHFVHLAIHSR